jgi:peroxin-11B
LQRLESIEKGGFKALKEDEVLRKEHLMLKAEQPKLVMELLQDSLDVVIPAALLEYLPVSQGVVGLVGTITSLMGVFNAWPRS